MPIAAGGVLLFEPNRRIDSGTYAGPVLRAQADDGSSTQADFFINSDQELVLASDAGTTTIDDWVASLSGGGATEARCRTMYDQSGNGSHVTQSTFANMGLIGTDGPGFTPNYVAFDNANTEYDPGDLLSQAGVTLFAVAERGSNAGLGYIWAGLATSGNLEFSFTRDAGLARVIIRLGTNSPQSWSTGESGSVRHLICWRGTGSLGEVWVDGIAAVTDHTYSGSATNTDQWIGRRQASPNGHFHGRIYSLYAYDSALSNGDRLQTEDDARTFLVYGPTGPNSSAPSVTSVAPANIAPGSTGWQAVDLTGTVTAGSKGVLIHFINETGGTVNAGARKFGSSDSFLRSVGDDRHCWFHVGIDEDEIVELYQDVTGGAFHCYLEFGPNWIFETDKPSIDAAMPTQNVWSNVNIDVYGSAAPPSLTAVITHGEEDGSRDYDVRPDGTSLSQRGTPKNTLYCTVDPDTNIFEAIRDSLNQNVYLTGYTVDEGWAYASSRQDVTPGGTSGFEDFSTTGVATGIAFIALDLWGINTSRNLAARTDGVIGTHMDFLGSLDDTADGLLLAVSAGGGIETRRNNSSTTMTWAAYYIQPDADGADLVRVVSEAVHTSEGGLRTRARTRLVGESVAVPEGQLRARARAVHVDEVEAISSAELRARARHKVRDETVAIGEARIAARQLRRVIDETVATLEAAGHTRGRRQVVDETVAVLEARVASLAQDIVRVISEICTIAESTGQARGLAIVISETVAIATSALRVRALTRQIDELLAIAESAAATRFLIRVRDETVGVGEITGRPRTLARVRDEVVALTEARAVHRALTRVRDELLAVEELARQTVGLVRVIAETVAIGETLAHALTATLARLLSATVRLRVRLGGEPSVRPRLGGATDLNKDEG